MSDIWVIYALMSAGIWIGATIFLVGQKNKRGMIRAFVVGALLGVGWPLIVGDLLGRAIVKADRP